MEKYQIFAVSAGLFIVANYWFLISKDPLIPRSADYIAYAFFIWGMYKIFKKQK